MKKIIIVFFTLIFVFSFTFETFATNNMKVVSSSINTNKNNITITGEFPVISGLSSASFQKGLNEKIDEIIKTKTTSYSQKKINKIDVSYDVIQDNNIISIMIYFKNSYTKEVDVYSVNANIKSNSYVTINSYFNANGINYANKVVSNKASNMGITYKKVTDTTPFYIKNKNVYVVFGAGDITLVQKGNITFEIPYENLNNYQVSKDNYYKKSEYNVKMVPLRETLEYFGYTTNWNNSTNSITVLKDGKFVSYLVIGQNKYSDKNNKIIRQLEFAPEIKNSKTYVPISYFSQILEMLFATDNNENIIISSYQL